MCVCARVCVWVRYVFVKCVRVSVCPSRVCEVCVWVRHMFVKCVSVTCLWSVSVGPSHVCRVCVCPSHV